MAKVGYESYRPFLETFVARLRKHFGEDVILAVTLFGSVARGEAAADSDLDLLVVHKPVDCNPVTEFVRFWFAMREKIAAEASSAGLDPRPSPLFLTERELWERPLILLDVLDHGIVLYDCGVLARRLRVLRCRLRQLGSRKVTLEDGTWYWDLKPDWKPGEVFTL